MSDLNIQMKSKNGSSWDNLYPNTKGTNVTTNDGKTLEQHVEDNTKHITTTGNVSESTSSVLTITGGTSAVLGGGVSIQVKQANAGTSGYLSMADWNTFNNKQAALGFAPVNKAGDTMSGPLILSADPTQALQAATKQYVDAVKQGLDPKESVKAATTANITLSGIQTIDGVALSVNDRVLVKNQTTANQNGIYTVQSGSWTRAVDFDGIGGDVTPGAFTFVEQGTLNGSNGFVLITTGTITVGTTDLNFSQFSGAGQVITGTGLTKSGNTISIGATGVAAGTYKSVTVNAQGQVTAGSNPTTLSGYGITDATPSSHIGTGGTAHANATETTAGFMSSTDKVKLDNLSAESCIISVGSTDPTTAAADFWYEVV